MQIGSEKIVERKSISFWWSAAEVCFVLFLFGSVALCWAEGPSKNTHLRIEKSKRSLTEYEGSMPIKSFTVSLGGSPEGAKRCKGDQKTPEGTYAIQSMNNKSTYYKSLKISYPNQKDMEEAKKNKCDPGGDIMIHGLPNSVPWLGWTHRMVNWTAGCIAITNKEIDYLWSRVGVGTKVEIVP